MVSASATGHKHGAVWEDREYELTVRQEPKQARMCGVGTKADRRPIDPPPVVQLRVIDKSTSRSSSPDEHSSHYNQSFLQNPYYFMYASLASPERDEELHLLKDGKTRCTTGSVVSSLYHLKDPEADGERGQARDAGFFVFPDLSVRTEGTYRLKLTLFEVIGANVHHCKSIFSAPFYVYTAKKFPGMEESTNLSCALADQGIKIRIRKDVRVRKRNIDPAWFQPLPPEQQYAPIEEPRSEGSEDEGDGARHGRDSKRARVGDAPGPANNAPPPPTVIPAPGAPGWGHIDPNLGNGPPQTSAAGPPPSQPPPPPAPSSVPSAPENAQYDSRAYGSAVPPPVTGHHAQQQPPQSQPQQQPPPPPAPSSSSSGHAEYHHPPPPHVMQHPGHGHAPPPPPGNMYAPYGQPQWGPPVPQAPYPGYHQQPAYDHHAHQHQHQPPPSHHQQQQQQHRGPPPPPPQQGHYGAPPAPGPQPPVHYGQPPPPPYGYYDPHGQYIPPPPQHAPAPAPAPAPTQGQAQGQGQAPGSPHQRAKEGSAGAAYSSPPGVQMMPPHPSYAGQEYAYGRPPPPPAPQGQQQDTRGAPPPANRGYQQQPSPYPPSAGQQAPPPQHQQQQQQHGMGHYMGHPPPHHQGYVYPQGAAPDPYQQWSAGQYAGHAFGGYGRPPMSNGQWPAQPPATNGAPPPPPSGQAGPSSLQQQGPPDAYAAPQHQVDRAYQHQTGAPGGYVRPGPDDGSGRRTPPVPSISVQGRGYAAQGGASGATMVGASGVMNSPSERRMSTNNSGNSNGAGVNGSPAGSAGATAVGMSPDRIQLAPLRANNNATPPPPTAGVGGPYAPYGLNRSNSSYGPGSKKNPLSIGSIISDETS